MAIELDHLILAVGDRSKSIDFYGRILGFAREDDDGPFATLRVSPGFVILLAESGSPGGEHLAFAMSQEEFESAFERLKIAAVAYGDQYDSVGNMQGPANESGARGMGRALYFFDLDRHLIEIRYYDSEPG